MHRVRHTGTGTMHEPIIMREETITITQKDEERGRDERHKHEMGRNTKKERAKERQKENNNVCRTSNAMRHINTSRLIFKAESE